MEITQITSLKMGSVVIDSVAMYLVPFLSIHVLHKAQRYCQKVFLSLV